LQKKKNTVKVRMQTDPTQFSTVMKSTTSILRNEGIAAFWKGAIPTAMGMAAENVMAFGVNEALKRAFPDEKDQSTNNHGPPSLLKPFIMGAITGCCSALVLLPSEVVKCKLQMVQGANATSQYIMSEMQRKQGRFAGYCIGLEAQLARDSSFYAVFFGGYEMFCYLFRTNIPTMPEELNYFISGGLAGMLGWTVAMPLDVPKTNVQASYESKVIGSYVPEMIRIYKQRGIGGLYSGLGPTLVRAFPANAALFLGVEMSRKGFDTYLWKES
jgi:Mitochondrial carrier protein